MAHDVNTELEFHPLPDGCDSTALARIAGELDRLAAELPDATWPTSAAQFETAARLTAARAVLCGHAVVSGWDIAYRDDIGASALVDADGNLKLGDLTKGSRPDGHVVGNVTAAARALLAESAL